MTAAAAALSYTPSAVSQAIAALEREAGAAVQRGPRGVRLTEAGAVLARHAARAARAPGARRDELADHVGLRAGGCGSPRSRAPARCSCRRRSRSASATPTSS